MEWVVVEFDDLNKSTSLVPKSWLFEDNNLCFWPKYDSQLKFNKAVQKQKEPMSDWKSYPITKILYTTSNYYCQLIL